MLGNLVHVPRRRGAVPRHIGPEMSKLGLVGGSNGTHYATQCLDFVEVGCVPGAIQRRRRRREKLIAIDQRPGRLLSPLWRQRERRVWRELIFTGCSARQARKILRDGSANVISAAPSNDRIGDLLAPRDSAGFCRT